MITQKIAEEIGYDWVEKWNMQQLYEYSMLYEDNAEEISSIANRIISMSNGHLKGKNNLLNYWHYFRRRFPNYSYVFHHSNIYQDMIIVYFTINALNTLAIAKISISDQMKIKQIRISHV